MKKILYILFSLIFVINCSFAQKNKPSTPPELHKNVKKRSNNLVLSYPPNKYTERIYKKLQKTKLTKKEQLVLVKASLTNKPLTPFEKFIYLRAIRKIKKRKRRRRKALFEKTFKRIRLKQNSFSQNGFFEKKIRRTDNIRKNFENRQNGCKFRRRGICKSVKTYETKHREKPFKSPKRASNKQQKNVKNSSVFILYRFYHRRF